MEKIYFISGVNGIGKSSIIPFLLPNLPGDKFEIHDFDERGVPDDADKNWRISTLEYWINKGVQNIHKNKNTIICGFVKLTDFQGEYNLQSLEIIGILLDAKANVVKKRLQSRYSKKGVFDKKQIIIGKSIDKFIEGNIYILGKMRKDFEESGCKIIDTSELTPEEVARKIVDLVLYKEIVK